MKVIITHKELVEAGASLEGLMRFAILNPSGVMEIEWPVENQLRLIQDPFGQYYVCMGILQKSLPQT